MQCLIGIELWSFATHFASQKGYPLITWSLTRPTGCDSRASDKVIPDLVDVKTNEKGGIGSPGKHVSGEGLRARTTAPGDVGLANVTRLRVIKIITMKRYRHIASYARSFR